MQLGGLPSHPRVDRTPILMALLALSPAHPAGKPRPCLEDSLTFGLPSGIIIHLLPFPLPLGTWHETSQSPPPGKAQVGACLGGAHASLGGAGVAAGSCGCRLPRRSVLLRTRGVWSLSPTPLLGPVVCPFMSTCRHFPLCSGCQSFVRNRSYAHPLLSVEV